MTVFRPIAFVLAASNHGSMIVNRHDYQMVDAKNGYGVGYQILGTSSFDQSEVDLALLILKLRKFHFGDGVMALDCGANIGVHTVEWSRAMTGWGRVTAFEAQERVYYALAGNIAINNCLNASARHVALGSECGSLEIPEPDYTVPSSFGSLELRGGERNEFIGQKIDYSADRLKPVTMISIDSLNLQRVDFLKIDVEGMEVEVLAGAAQTIARCHPVLLVEIIKSNPGGIADILHAAGYKLLQIGINALAIHESDPLQARIRLENNAIHIS